jgi:hypothetical protein
MKIEERIAKSDEFAAYEDGTFIHVGLARGHNGGIDEKGFNHQEVFEARKASGVYPYQIEGIRVTAVSEHTKNGTTIKPYWRGIAEDVERIINDPESNFHKMAKEACVGLLKEGKFNAIVKRPLQQFEFGGCALELPISADGRHHFADIGVWDHRFPDDPIAMEITYRSPQTKERIMRLSEAGVHVYDFNILDRTRNALREGRKVDIDFYRRLMLDKKFELKSGKESKLKLDALYLHVAMLKEQEERKLAMQKAAELWARRDIELRQEQDRRNAYTSKADKARADEVERQYEAWRKRQAELKAISDKKREDHHALCRRCAHRDPCPYFMSSACGPDLHFTCA